MKKWISYIMASVLLLTCLVPVKVSAAASGELMVKNNDVEITLDIPDMKTENITSLRFRLAVTVTSGNMDKPAFVFSDTVKSTVKDASVSKEENGRYIVDVILSGKKNENILDSTGKVQPGKLSLYPSGSKVVATVEITGEDGTSPSVTVVNSIGQSVVTVSLENAGPVTITATGSNTDRPGGSVIGGGGGAISPSGTSAVTTSPAPAATETAPAASSVPTASSAPAVPDKTSAPFVTASPATPGTDTIPEVTVSPGVSKEPAREDDFKNKKPVLKVSAKNGSKNIVLKWNKVPGADGYIIYKYSKDAGKYKQKKIISDKTVTKCTMGFSYATTYSFKIRAYKTSGDGDRIYGSFGTAAKVTTAPAGVKRFIVKRINNNRISLSWKKVKNADGYQILRSTKKNGVYSVYKVIKKGSRTKYKARQKNGKIYHYKVRAYVKGTGGKHVYGRSSVKK